MPNNLGKDIRLVAFDLDGTLLNDERQISSADINSLHKLARKNILRVAATGRNLLSLNRVLTADFPIDYAVFSSGAGIINWRTKKVLVQHSINQEQISRILALFKEYNISFTIHAPIPNSHKMLLHNQDNNSHDLKNYTSFYDGHVSNYNENDVPEKASQLIGLLYNKKIIYDEIKSRLADLKCILTTSPVDRKSLWIEVFNVNVSKASGIEWIMKEHNMQNQMTFSVGNDYNDIDMLKFTNESFVVSNANKELLKYYRQTLSNNCSGFTAALKQVVDL